MCFFMSLFKNVRPAICEPREGARDVPDSFLVIYRIINLIILGAASREQLHCMASVTAVKLGKQLVSVASVSKECLTRTIAVRSVITYNLICFWIFRCYSGLNPCATYFGSDIPSIQCLPNIRFTAREEHRTNCHDSYVVKMVIINVLINKPNNLTATGK